MKKHTETLHSTVQALIALSSTAKNNPAVHLPHTYHDYQIMADDLMTIIRDINSQ